MIEKLAYSIGRKDENPNIELAEELIKTRDENGVKEIVEGLSSDNPNIANDCIKVLYEIGYRKPQMIAEYAGVFIDLLKAKNNRLVWGAAIALANTAPLKAPEIYKNIDDIITAYEKGSVITVDNLISVFAELAKADIEYEKTLFPLIIKHLESCRPKEVGQHAERSIACVNKNNSDDFKKVLLKRLDDLTDPQKKRVNKLLKKIEND